MPIQSPAFRESPVNLLSSRPAVGAHARKSPAPSANDGFASMLGAQKPRISLAETARQAQRSPVPRDHAEPSPQSSTSKSAEASELEAPQESTSETHERETTASDSRRNVHEPASATDGDAAVISERGAPVVAPMPTPDADAPETKPARTDGTHTDPGHATVNGQPAPASVDATADADERKASPPVTRQGAVVKPAPSAAQDSTLDRTSSPSTARPQQRTSDEPVRETRSAGDGRTTSQPAAAGSAPDTAQVDIEITTDVGKRAMRSSTQPAHAQAAVAQLETEDRRQIRTQRQASGVQVERMAGTVQGMRRESEVHRATRDAIDKLLSEPAPRGSDVNQTSDGAPRPAETSINPEAGPRPAGHSQVAPSSPATAQEPPGFSLASTLSNAAGAAPQSFGSVSSLAGETGQTTNTGTTTAGSEWMTRSDHAAGRILRGLSAMINQHGGSMTMRLDPPELGSLRIQMTISNGSVSAAFAPSSAAARSLLEQNMTQLRTALESQGLMVDKLSIQTTTTSQTNTQAGHQHGTDEQRGHDQHADAGHGESRGRREHEGERQGSANQFFDPAMLFDMNDGTTFAPAFAAANEERTLA